jgi:isoleucyl-tRNA synthetase
MEINFPKLEEKILKFWEENRTFERSIKQRAGARDFVFYEGPPTANAKAGIHHVLARIYKDIICRYKTMQGFRVLRKAGWDTHGLPVELEIEKKLGLKSKKDIEKYGIAKFNQKCQESVWTYKKDWEKLTERIGFWLDMENPYITYESDYIETLWWIIKQIYQKGLLYKDYKVIPYCPRCGTSLSSHEVALGYKKIKEPAIYVKFEVKIQNSKFKIQNYNSKFKTYLLIWTTTPWTLPGNVAVAVNPKFTYARVKVNDEYLILAKERIGAAGIEGKIVEEFKGKNLLGLKYEPLFAFHKPDKKAWFVVSADFVSLDEGTGLVHMAPAFGEEDMQVAKKNNLPIILNVDKEGKFKKEVKKWPSFWVKDADPLIIEDLKKRNLLFKKEIYEHDYPFCWRCDSPLLYYAKESWFIEMQKVKDDLIGNNQKINWIPAHLKEGRFGEWLKELKDWAFSRERYWGTPLPIWQCQKCGHLEVIGSKKDLIKQKFSTNQYYILRHGQTIHQTKKKEWIYPWPEKKPILLTLKGRAQIKKAAEELKNKKIDLIYSSDINRARQTAEIVAKELGVHPVKSAKGGARPVKSEELFNRGKQFNRVKIIFDKRLRDINLGIYHGRSKKEDFYRDFPKTVESIYGRKPPRGENWGEVRKRMVDCLSDIDKKHQQKTILIVSHGDPLWLLRGAVEGLDDKELLDIKIKGTDIKTGEWKKIEYKKIPLNKEGKLDLHRPYIDEVKFYCPKCQGKIERVKELIDVWFDSGSMPFAQYHYPFENKELIDKKKQFPADYISEAVDQTRGWFYTLLAVSTLLGKGPAYKNAISVGHVLDEKGEKMSKSKGNVVDPWYIIEKYGADATRWYFYTVNQPGDIKLFSEKDIDQALKKFILTFWNSYVFYKTYVTQFRQLGKSSYVLNRWIISKLNGLILGVTQKLNNYNVTGAARDIENFVINDLSLWYIRRSRKRFKEVASTLAFVLQTLSRLTSPFIPFLSEEIYKNVRSSKFDIQSVHLEDWPKANKKLIDKELNQKMEKVREIVTLALAERSKAGIKVRQPLAELQIKEKIDKELIGLIKEEVNVKKITFGKTFKLDTKITPALKEEGMVREVIRQIQEMRKKAGLKPKDKILVQYFGDPGLNKILERNKKLILDGTKAENFILKEKSKKVFLIESEIKIDQQNLWLSIIELKG